jgi:5-hydroxyisourate hydrolase
MPSTDPITCHILDSTTGRPAAQVAVTLRCSTVPDIVFIGASDADGRISNWNNTQGPPLPGETIGSLGAFVELHGGVNSSLEYMVGHYAGLATSNSPVASSVWKLESDLAEYFGAGTIKLASMSVEVLVKLGEQTHISIQAGPYGATVNSV